MSENNSGWWHRYSENEGTSITHHVEWIPMLLDEADTILNYVGDIEPRLEISDIERGAEGHAYRYHTACFLFKQGDERHCISWWTDRPDELIDSCQERGQNTLYLIRGLPGSGKTTIANIIAPGNSYSSDDYFTDKDGVYTFVGAELKYSHWGCAANVEAAMKDGAEKVAVHNTLSTSQEAEEYFRMAQKHGYRVQVIECQGQFGSTHDIPDHTIRNMKARWESDITPHVRHHRPSRQTTSKEIVGSKPVRCNACKDTSVDIPGERHSDALCDGRWVAMYDGGE